MSRERLEEIAADIERFASPEPCGFCDHGTVTYGGHDGDDEPWQDACGHCGGTGVRPARETASAPERPTSSVAPRIGWWLSDLPNPGPYYSGTMRNVVANALGIDTEEEWLVILRERDCPEAPCTRHNIFGCSWCGPATPTIPEPPCMSIDWHDLVTEAASVAWRTTNLTISYDTAYRVTEAALRSAMPDRVPEITP
mgnify:CR=1 FL=1